MDFGDLKFGLFIVGCAIGGIGVISIIVYIAVTVAKFAWGS